jgi:uncharacterized protein (TIGR00251 family)
VLSVRVQPRASSDAILGWRDGTLRVRVTARPVEGEANLAVARLLARALRVAPSAVAVVHGARARDKRVRVAGLDAAEVRNRLDSLQ